MILDQISDGKLYGVYDWVAADTSGCNGCSACCHGVGELVILNPHDFYAIKKHLGLTNDTHLSDFATFKTNDRITLPHLKTIGENERCVFLNDQDRCRIHPSRPNICRLFPLGRVYDTDTFHYFLQTEACIKPKLENVRIFDWIAISDYDAHRAFVLSWYHVTKALKFRLKFERDEAQLKALQEMVLSLFYSIEPLKEETFFEAFAKKLPSAKKALGIL